MVSEPAKMPATMKGLSAVFVTLALMLAGCPSDSLGTDGGEGLPDGRSVFFDAGNLDGGVTSFVRVVNAAVGSPLLDVSLSTVGTPVAQSLAFGKASSYLSVPAGLYDVVVKDHAAPTGQPLATAAQIRLSLGLRYTFVTAGVVGSTDESNLFRVIAVPETFFPASDETARILFVHAVPDGVNYDMDLGDDGNPEVQALARFNPTAGQGVEIEARHTTLSLAGSPDGGYITAFDVPTLASHGNYVMVVAGLQGVPADDPTGLVLLGANSDGTVFQSDPLPSLVAFHAIADTAGVDVFRDGRKIADNLAYGQTSVATSLAVDGGTVFKLLLHQDGGDRGTYTTTARATRTRSLGLFSGAGYALGPSTVRLDVIEEGFTEPTGTQTTLRAVNAVPDALSLDFGSVTGSTLTTLAGLTSVTYGSASDPTGAVQTVGSAQLGAAKHGVTSPLASLAFNLPTGTQGFLIALGFVTPAAGAQGVSLVRVDVPLAVGVPWVATPGAH